MKLTLFKNNFKEAVSVAERIAAKTPTLPVLSSILLSATNNTFIVSATDLEIGVRYTMLSKNEKEGRVTLPPKHLSQFLSFLEEGKITLEQTKGGLFLNTKGNTTQLTVSEADEFPIIPSLVGNEPFIEVETTPFCKGLSQVIGMAGQSQARPEISGILFVVQGKTLKMVATDSFRLAEKTMSFEKEQTKEQRFILPQKTAREVIAILGEKQGKTKIYLASTQAVFDYVTQDDPAQTHIEIVSRLIEGEYPDYQAIIPKEYQTKTVAEKADLLTHIKASSVFAGKMSEVRLLFDPARKGVEMTAQSAEAGENTSFLEAEVTGDKSEVSFNWRFVVDGLIQIKGQEIEVGVSSEAGPTSIKPTTEEGYQYVVMPVRS